MVIIQRKTRFMKIVDIARGYIGEFEVAGNQGFKDKKFEAKMVEDGFNQGDSWCCIFQNMIWEEAYPEHEEILNGLFHKSCDKTLKNFKAAGYGISMTPVVGSLMIMKHFIDGKEQWTGHAGVVVEKLNSVTWISIEGNTNSKGSREGDSVQPKTRTLTYPKTGLHLAGFVLIRETLKIVD
jgi:hypothetical protein